MTSLSEQTRESFFGPVSAAGSIILVSHNGPDGDAAGCLVALKNFISEIYGKDVCAMVPSPLPDYLSFLTGGEDILVFKTDGEECLKRLKNCSLLICLDLNKLDRTAEMADALRALDVPKILVDHHLNPATDEFGTIFSRTDISSACELLYSILLTAPQIGSDASKLPAKTAVALMTGMTTDTNNFANSVFPSTLQMASELLAAGVDRDEIIQHLYNEYRPNRVAAFSHMLSEELRTTEGGAAYMVLTKELSERFGLLEGETEGLVNIPLSIKKIRLSILLKEDDGYFRVSIRSKKGTSANALATRDFHGGGHEQASGGRLYFPEDIASPADAAEYIEKATARFLQGRVPENK